MIGRFCGPDSTKWDVRLAWFFLITGSVSLSPLRDFGFSKLHEKDTAKNAIEYVKRQKYQTGSIDGQCIDSASLTSNEECEASHTTDD